MTLFRFHRGSLEESLKTTIIVKTLNDVIEAVVTGDIFEEEIRNSSWEVKFHVEPYGSEAYCFDPRIGWYTKFVFANLYKKK